MDVKTSQTMDVSETELATKKLNESNNDEIVENDISEEGINNGAAESEDDTASLSEEVKYMSKKRKVIESDNDSDGGDVEDNSTIEKATQLNNEAPVYTVSDSGNLISEEPFKKSLLSDLCDPESSEDERQVSEPEEPIAPIPYKKKKKKTEEPDNTKMSAKEYKEQLKDIRSESQRMLRESKVSLPYHRPKARSLKEFLEKRPRFVAAQCKGKIGNTPPSIAIKMSTNDLQLISKKMQEREKVIEEFYKSESEDENKNDDDSEEETVENEALTNSTSANNDINTEILENNDKNTQNNVQTANEEVDEQINLPKEYNTNSNTDVSIIDINKDEIRDGDKNNKDSNEIDKSADNNKDFESINNHSEINNSFKQINDVNDNVNKDNIEVDTDIMEIAENAEIVITYNKINELETSNEIIPDKNTQNESAEYDFSLEEVDCGETSVNDEETTAKDGETTVVSEKDDDARKLDYLLEKFGREDETDEIDEAIVRVNVGKMSQLQLLKEQVGDTRPRLSGHPNDIIDLDESSNKPNGVTKLMERFIEHTKKKARNTKIEVNVISLSGGEAHSERITMKVDTEEAPVVAFETPGAKLKRLRLELRLQMAEKRATLWRERQALRKAEEEEDEEEEDGCSKKDKCGYEEDVLEEDTNENEEDNEEDEDLLEDDVDIRERKKVSSEFIDEEAELSENENENCDENVNEDDDENNEDDIEDSNDDDDEESESLPDTNEPLKEKKKLKRIIQNCDDSDDDEEKQTEETMKTFTALDSTDPWDEDEDYVFPAAQSTSGRTPQRNTQLSGGGKSRFAFLTPVVQLTGLQDLTSGFLHDDNPVNLDDDDNIPLTLPSPLRSQSWQRETNDELSPTIENTQQSVNMEELADEICSGKFPTQTQILSQSVETTQPTTQDMLNICSGNFTGFTQKPNNSLNKINQATINATSNTISSQERSAVDIIEICPLNKTTTSLLLGDSEDKLIAQLLDEEEMAKFKKKFESPVELQLEKEVPENSNAISRIMFDSSSDDDDDDTGVGKKNSKKLVKKKKSQRKIEDTDDESSEDNEENDDQDDLLPEEENLDDEQPENVDYDSEENEIDGTQTDIAVKKPRLKATDFFEQEAELSESEWGSADEDEKDLDTMDYELGDSENIDQNKVRRDLERIHMRQVQDDDSKQVKILQELLLEDGELHGSGRERQFRWKNIDNVDENNEKENDEENEFAEEGESEEQWRKMRHERNIFLKKQQESSQDLDNDDAISFSSEVLKLGKKAIVRNASNSQNGIIKEKEQTDEVAVELKQPFTLLNKRGSFLTRSDRVLAKVAEYSKTQAVNMNGPTKFSRNFVFSSLSSDISTNLNDKKRKANDGTPTAIKKLRLTNLSPAVTHKTTRVNKLFST